MIKTDKYPVFKPNQVLSEGQMNEILTYLEPQDRVTRTLAIGRGILCGLELQIAADSIIVRPGIGLTSAGYILAVPQAAAFNHAVAFTPNNSYKPFLGPNGTDHIDLLALTESHDPENPTSVALADLTLEDYVIAIFLNAYEFDLTTCLPENCDNQGAEQRLEWYVLLLKRDDALEVIKNADSRLGSEVDEAGVTRILHARYELQPLTLRRPLLGPTNVVRYSTLTGSYSNICREELGRFKEALNAACSCYQPILGAVNTSQVVEILYTQYRRLNDGRGLQYFWDFLDDLFHAYNEFVDQAFLLTTVSGIAAGAFSQHLFLGPGEAPGGCRPTIFRHYFAPACQDYFYGDLPGQVRTLFERILNLVKGFNWKPDSYPLRITPQTLGSGFGRRAIAHYLDRGQVADTWSIDARRRCRQDRLAAYDREDDRILQENLADANHLRIEGHMYRKKEEVVEALEELRATYNLPFKVKCLELGAVPEFSSGGCNIGVLRTLYEITRLDALCFIEDKIRFLNSLVADDLQFDTPEEELEEREKERKPTKIETAKKLDYAEVIDFSRNKVFTIQKRKAQQQGALNLLVKTKEASTEALAMGSAAVPVEQPQTFSTRSLIYEPTTVEQPYAGRKQSRYEKDFDTSELDKIEVPSGVKELVEREPTVKRLIKQESFAAGMAPKAEAVKKEIPVEEDGTSFTVKARDIAFAFPKTPVTDYIQYPKDELGDRLLSELVGNLVKMLEELPEEVHLFDADEVQKIYAVIKDKALALKDVVEELLGSQDYAPKGVEYALIAQLLELVDACLDTRLGKIFDMHNAEWQAAENAGILADYIKQHSSLHHCGGVHIGGTHVIVSGYIDKVREITKIKELTRPLFVKAPLAVYQELRGNVYENVLRTAGHFNRKAFTWSKKIDLERIEKKTPSKTDPVPAITLDRTRSALLDGLIRSIESSSDEELVLFDFCHPYICCSDCASVEYVVIAELKLYLPKLAFCADDSDNYAFGVYPPGGSVKGPGVKKIGETYYFIPANSSVGEQLFSYEFGGREVQLVARVMARPQARYSYTVKEFAAGEDGVAAAAVVQFTNLSVDADQYLWDFGDGLTTSEDSPAHTFDLSGQNTFSVTLTASVEACRDQSTQVLSLVQIEFYIEKHITEFCNNDSTAYQLITNPTDGGVFGEHPAVDPETRTFHPDRVNLEGEKKVSHELCYQLDQQLASLFVDVYAPPQPQFSVEILESGDQSVIVRFINQTVNGSDFTWDFGDGQNSTRPDPTHEYKVSGETEFTVVLTALNGPCQDSIEKPLSLTPLTMGFAGETDGRFCENDETGIELVGTPAGGVFSGPGVEENRFVPALVKMGVLSKKTVTLRYTLDPNSASLLAEIYKAPALGFTYQVKPASQGVLVAFTNQSAHAENYIWNYGDDSQEQSGYNISHIYKAQGVYQVTLKGSNPSCEEKHLTLPVVAKVENVPPEIVPLQPLKILNEALAQPKVQSLLKEYGINGAYLAEFYSEMINIVRSGEDEVIVGFIKDPALFVGPVNEIGSLGEQMRRYGPDLHEIQLSQVIGVYRLSIGNIMNVFSRRQNDLNLQSELYALLKKLTGQAGELSSLLNFNKYPTTGFELVPQDWFAGLSNLQKLHIAFGKVL